jgi:hypothetical protein
MSSAFPQSTGATVTSDGTYLYYQFTTNGTFIVPYDVVCPVLLVGGGGGGGVVASPNSYSNVYVGGGGGSAGEVVYGNVGFQNNVVYNVGVGSGGTGGKISVFGSSFNGITNGTNGTPSSLFGGSVNVVANGGGVGFNGSGGGSSFLGKGGFGGNTTASTTYTGFVDNYTSFVGNGVAGNSYSYALWGSSTRNTVYNGGRGGWSGNGTMIQWNVNKQAYAAAGLGGNTAVGATQTNRGSGGGGGYLNKVTLSFNYKNANNGVGGIVVVALPPFVTRATFNSLPTFTPAGSIASYLGTTDPDGWVICDGAARTVTDARYTYVLAMGIGSGTVNNYTPPDYRGAFLRGSGTNGTNSTYAGPTNGTSQTDDITSHTHTLTDPGHTHVLDVRTSGGQQTSFKTLGFSWNSVNNLYQTKTSLYYSSSVMCELGQNSILSSSSSLSIANYGDTETRPVNFGVNWILKL